MGDERYEFRNQLDSSAMYKSSIPARVFTLQKYIFDTKQIREEPNRISQPK